MKQKIISVIVFALLISGSVVSTWLFTRMHYEADMSDKLKASRVNLAYQSKSREGMNEFFIAEIGRSHSNIPVDTIYAHAIAYIDSLAKQIPANLASSAAEQLVRNLKALQAPDTILAAAYNTAAWYTLLEMRTGKAEDFINKAYNLDSTNWEIKKNMALVYLCSGKGEVAGLWYEKAMQENVNGKDVFEKDRKLLIDLKILKGDEQ